MQTTYVQKDDLAQRNADKSAEAVLDASSQSESLQRKADMANNAAQRAEAPRPNNTGLPDNLKSGIESLSGFSMDDVRVHYNSSKPATVQALAYTQGTDIHVAPGQEKCLPHEAWHVAQQMAGRVSPTTNINGMPVNDNAALEHEADVMGEKAVQCKFERKNNSECLRSKTYAIQCKPGNESGVVHKQGDHLFTSITAEIDELTGNKKDEYRFIKDSMDKLDEIRENPKNIGFSTELDSNTEDWRIWSNQCRLCANTYISTGHGGYELVSAFRELAKNCIDENVEKKLLGTSNKKFVLESIEKWNDECSVVASKLLAEMADCSRMRTNNLIRLDKKLNPPKKD